MDPGNLLHHNVVPLGQDQISAPESRSREVLTSSNMETQLDGIEMSGRVGFKTGIILISVIQTLQTENVCYSRELHMELFQS